MRALAALLLVAALAGCESETEDPIPDAKPPATTTTPPAVPDPPSLVERLKAATSHDRAAGELQQLAARHLAQAPTRVRERVLDRVSSDALTANTRAAMLLSAMTDPQPKLPTWRIVEPPPPRELLSHYRAAERATGVPWEYLAAIHLVETRMGRIRGTSTAGAQGPMQFLPSTWAAYGAGGDIEDPGDAIRAAARLLRANGAPANMAGALWNYNHSDSYVRAVTLYAGVMRRDPSSYRSYWHWRVLYKHRRGTYVLPAGYPAEPAVLLGPLAGR